ncbi:methyltransferase [Aquincola sp. MAHUQ-54]|uniref:Methyltransferase n=1 Tax=Aquincola agrisoli TaxID=3119538 RepID=A0AAW9Q2G8_9BURK
MSVMDPQNEPFERAKQDFFAGLDALKAQRLPEAEQHFCNALELVPGRPSVLVNRAAVLLLLGRPDEALADADAVLLQAPDDVDALFHRGTALGRLGRLPAALAAFERLVAIDPRHVEGRRRHAQTTVALAGQAGSGGRLADAADAYRVLLQLQPESAADWSAYGTVLRELRRPQEAAEAFRAALRHGGDDPLDRFYLAATAGTGGPAAPPRQYVRALFDDYADDFEGHLLGQLGYAAHVELTEPLAVIAPVPRRATLDLGCGTGLCGPLLRAGTSRLVGVDLSPRMLEKARSLQLYDALAEADLVEHLGSTSERFDLVVAADVFIYVGDLDPVFAGVRRVLHAGGVFCFSVEAADAGEEGFRLLPSLRYAHSQAYVRRLAAAHGLEVLALRQRPIRREQAGVIDGVYVYLRRASA